MSDFWSPEPIWRGVTAFLLAGGPSLRDVDLTRLRGRHVLTINSSHERALAAALDDGVLFFTDTDWYLARREMLARWRGPVISAASGRRPALPHSVHQVRSELRPDFPRLGAPVIRKGRSSGHTAIGLAVALGAARIVLLGYDMRTVDGRTHHHEEYRQADLNLYAVSFIPAFKGWNDAAAKAGVEIVNATAGSALREFPIIGLDEVLACVRS